MDNLGVKSWCSYCQGCKKENGELVCRDKNGAFYGLPVRSVLCTPCMEPKKDD